MGGVIVLTLAGSTVGIRSELNRLGRSAQDTWTHTRAFIRGLAVAWVSAASVITGLLIFAIAPPAQDLFLEVRGSRLIGFLFWLGFYAAVAVAWIVPVYVSAKWILYHCHHQSARPSHALPVEDWVLGVVPRVLATMCLVAILVGQLMALKNSPTLADDTSPLRKQQLEAELNSACGAVAETSDAPLCIIKNFDTVAKLFATEMSQSTGGDDTIIFLYVLTFVLPVFFGAIWIWRHMYASGPYARATVIILSVSVFLVCGLVLGGYVSDLQLLFQTVLPQPIVGAILLGSFFVGWSLIPFAADRIPWKLVRIPIRVAWWTITLLFVLTIVVMAVILDYGFVVSELDKRLGLGHVALLPLITLLLIYGAWRVLRPAARAPLGDGESTRLAAAGSAPLEEGRSPSRRLQQVYAGVLVVTLLLFLAQAPVRPVIVTEYVYRALAAPFLLGMLVPVLTLFSYLSLRLRVPVIALGIAVFSLLVATHSELNDVRPISRSARRPTLEDSVNRWAAVNGCDWRSNAEACPSPIIVSAAGGASRAAFLTASVIGKLMDETDLPRPFGKQVFAISAVSGGSLGAVITYAALADSQIREKAINGLGAPPCDRNAHDSEWFRSDPAWGWLADTKPSSASHNDQAAETQPATSPDTKWRECLQRILAGDFLSPVVVSLISNDLLGFSLLGDRATILENAWEQRYAHQTGQLIDYEKEASTLQGSLVDLRQRVLADANNWLPVLLLNGTSVTTGRRIVTTDIDTLLARTPLTDPGVPSLETTPVSRSSSRLFRDAYDLHELFEIETPIRGFSAGRFSPDGSTFLTVLGDKVQFWETETGNELRPITIAARHAREEPRAALKTAVTGEAAKQKSVRHAAFNATGKLLLIANDGGVVSVWDFANRRQLWDSSSEEGGVSTIATGEAFSAQFSPDGERVLTMHGSRMVHLWNAATGQRLKSFTSPQGNSIEAAAFTPDGVRVITSDKTGLRQLWDVETSAKLLDLNGGSPDSGAAVFSADGRRVLTVPLFNADNKNWDGKAVLWDAVSGAQLKTLQHEVREPFVDYGFSPDGRVILTSTASTLVLWFEDGTSTSIQSEFSAQSGLRGATFSTDGKHLLLVDGVTAELWEIHDGAIQKRRIFKGEESWVSGAAFSGNDERILTWSDNGMAIVWDTDTGVEMQIVSVSRSTMARCENCDIRLSTATTMSARFPIISPHGNIRNTEKQIVDRVVDGGYYENFGATTALELAAELGHLGLKSSIILINNEPATSGMNCISASNRLTYPSPSQTMSFPIVQSPIFTVMGTRSARGSHAAVELCSAIGEQKFAFVTVAPDSRNPGKALSMSWWLSKYVQNYLDDQLSDGSANTGSFNAIRQWRSH